MQKMRSLIAMIVSAAAVLAIALVEIAEHVEMIERLIPERLVPMISEKLNFSLILVAILIFIVAYFDHKNDKRKYAYMSVDGAKTHPIDVQEPVDPLPVQLTHKPVYSGWTKPAHNVQCIGFKLFHDYDFVTATLGFQNVPTGKPLGKFERPRLRVIYYDHLTGEELADMCPAVWWNDSGDKPIEIGVKEQYALIASFFKTDSKWTACESNEPSEDFDAWHQLNSIELPTGDIRIIATLSSDSLRINPVEGVLTLEKDGNASFTEMKSSQ
jgi:hypothetical protein